jgi:hypothetical protein
MISTSAAIANVIIAVLLLTILVLARSLPSMHQ